MYVPERWLQVSDHIFRLSILQSDVRVLLPAYYSIPNYDLVLGTIRTLVFADNIHEELFRIPVKQGCKVCIIESSIYISHDLGRGRKERTGVHIKPNETVLMVHLTIVYVPPCVSTQ